MDHNRKQIVQNLLKQLLDKLRVEVTDIVASEHPIHKQTHFVIQSPDSKLLIGNQGAHLQAFTYLAKRIAYRALGDEVGNSFSIDVNDYHTRQLRALITRAKESAERARIFSRPVEMEPMSAYERMLVHAYFANNPRIQTLSEGEGKFRRVVVTHSAESYADHGV